MGVPPVVYGLRGSLSNKGNGMDIQVAHDFVTKIKAMEAALRIGFPCEECKGKGQEEAHYGWYPCESCYGQGYLIPGEE